MRSQKYSQQEDSIRMYVIKTVTEFKKRLSVEIGR